MAGCVRSRFPGRLFPQLSSVGQRQQGIETSQADFDGAGVSPLLDVPEIKFTDNADSIFDFCCVRVVEVVQLRKCFQGRIVGSSVQIILWADSQNTLFATETATPCAGSLLAAFINPTTSRLPVSYLRPWTWHDAFLVARMRLFVEKPVKIVL